MSLVSPENQLSSLPPDLTALVLTLLEVGGVDSMTAETKTHFTEKFARDGARDIARDVAIDCSWWKKSAPDFIEERESIWI